MLTLLLLAALLVPQTLLAQTATQPSVGDGTADNPYQITSAEELAWFRDEVNNSNQTACAKLMNDISMSSVCHAAGDDYEAELSWEPIGTDSKYFKGTFDGNNNTVSDLYINANQRGAGLFGQVSDAHIKNLTFKNAKVINDASQNWSGILVGYASSTTIQNIKTDETSSIIAGRETGGIAGWSADDCNVLYCENHATVNAYKYNTGGICGTFSGNGTGILKGCANYGTVTCTDLTAGGIAGSLTTNDGSSLSVTIEYCANYAAIKGKSSVGGIVGSASGGTLKNVFSNGNITTTDDYSKAGGMIIGQTYNYPKTYADGMIVYDCDATFTLYGSQVEARATGEGTLTSGVATGYSRDIISKGVATYQLQQNAADGVVWGQDLADNTKAYPVLGSTNKVYADGDVVYNCTGELAGSFTNTQPATEGTFTTKHGSITKHPAIPVTCVTDGQNEYYECESCHKTYSDESLTNEVSDIWIGISASGHDYYGHSDVCSKCNTEIPAVKIGNNTVKIDRTFSNSSYISMFTLFKYVATEDGILEMTFPAYTLPTYHVLFNSSKSVCTTKTINPNATDRTMAYSVTKGETYYVGVKEDNGNAIEGDYTFSIKINGRDYELPEGLAGSGTAAAPFELKTAEHLKWFADYVNGTEDFSGPHSEACAKLMNDIDMSSVCHATGGEYDTELNWKTIGSETANNAFTGTFDGNGHAISHLYINAKQDGAGMFGLVGEGSAIKNLTLDKAIVTNSSAKYRTGILVGKQTGGTIQNIKTTESSSVTGGNVTGGIVGLASGQIINCENRATVIAGSNTGTTIGGICGSYNTSTIKGCTNYGTVTTGGPIAGGIAGYLTSGTVEDCANYAAIQGTYNIGGIVGRLSGGKLKNVFSNGDVKATGTTSKAGVGGLVIGMCSGNASVTGLAAYDNEAKLTIEGSQAEAIAIGDGTLSSGTEYATAFTKAEIMSGEVAYKLNNGVTDGTQAWYQKLGEDGDTYPVLTPVEDNTVYYVTVGYDCEGTEIANFTPIYANTTTYSYTGPHDYQETLEASGLYASVCTKCHTYESDKRIVKNFAGEGKNLEVTEADGAYKVEQLTLTDGEPYNSPVTLSVGSMTYERGSFAGKAGNWQALYVPFALDCEELADEYEVAVINNFHEYIQKDGTTKVVLEALKLTDGTLQPLTPYLIRLKEDADDTQTQPVRGMACELVPSESRYIDCSSVTRYYKFTGILEAKTGFDTDQDFVLNNGKLYNAAANATLNPQRWYLTAIDRSGNGGSATPSTRLKSIAIDVVGESGTTGIEEIHVTTDIEDNASSRQGIYDLQGRKLDKEPESGIYIKNGKKQVK